MDIDERPAPSRLPSRRVLVTAAAALVVLVAVIVTVVLSAPRRGGDGHAVPDALLPPMPAGATACAGSSLTDGISRCWWTTNAAATTRVSVARGTKAPSLPGAVGLAAVPGAMTATVHGTEEAVGVRGGYVFAVELNDPVLTSQLGDTHPRAAELTNLALAVYQRLPT